MIHSNTFKIYKWVWQTDQRNVSYSKMQRGDIEVYLFGWKTEKPLFHIELFYFCKFLSPTNLINITMIHSNTFKIYKWVWQTDQRNVSYSKMQRGDIEVYLFGWKTEKPLFHIELFYFCKFLSPTNQNGLQVIHIGRLIWLHHVLIILSDPHWINYHNSPTILW